MLDTDIEEERRVYFQKTNKYVNLLKLLIFLDYLVQNATIVINCYNPMI